MRDYVPVAIDSRNNSSHDLIFILGAKWHSRRRILTPAFHFNILRKFVEILTEEGERMTQELKNFGGTIEIDVLPFASQHTLNAICGKSSY